MYKEYISLVRKEGEGKNNIIQKIEMKPKLKCLSHLTLRIVEVKKIIFCNKKRNGQTMNVKQFFFFFVIKKLIWN